MNNKVISIEKKIIYHLFKSGSIFVIIISI